MAKKRIAVTMQLVVGQDDDLIDFVDKIEAGQRNAVLKQCLRQVVFTPDFDLSVDTNDSASILQEASVVDLREDIENSWNTLIEELPTHIQRVVQEQVQEQVQKALANILSNGLGNQPVQASNNEAQISDEKKKKRKRNLAAQSW